jgi:hypothetical protein
MSSVSYTPFADPVWLNRGYSPYFTDSHRRLQKQTRKYVDDEISPFCEEWEKQGFVPAEVSSYTPCPVLYPPEAVRSKVVVTNATGPNASRKARLHCRRNLPPRSRVPGRPGSSGRDRSARMGRLPRPGGDRRASTVRISGGGLGAWVRKLDWWPAGGELRERGAEAKVSAGHAERPDEVLPRGHGTGR